MLFAGGHNVIGGLLDFLQERHPGSQLFGFLNGPGGIIRKSFMEITEDIMVGALMGMYRYLVSVW